MCLCVCGGVISVVEKVGRAEKKIEGAGRNKFKLKCIILHAIRYNAILFSRFSLYMNIRLT